jgi:lysophospholipase L1-like esterase
MIIGACSTSKDVPMMDPEEEEETQITNVNYLALGDSYTIGEGVDADLRWPNQLGDQLRAQNYVVDDIKIIAKTGWTTRNLLDAINMTDTKGYNLVSLLIGVNNQFQNKPFTQFTSEFDELLTKSIDIAGDKNRVFVVSIPDYGVTPFGGANSDKIAAELDMYNQYMAGKCKFADIPFIDITEKSRELGASEGALASDNLHPSGSQYTAWTNIILPFVIDILEQ